MYLSGYKEENFTDYYKPSMTIGFPSCTFKCGKWCQNYSLQNSNRIYIENSKIVDRYLHNSITKAIVFAGLEPFDSWQDLIDLIKLFREKTEDDIVIFTGYNEDEIKKDWINQLKKYPNIIIKFGRYIPNQEYHFDEILGINLASLNQYAKKIS